MEHAADRNGCAGTAAGGANLSQVERERGSCDAAGGFRLGGCFVAAARVSAAMQVAGTARRVGRDREAGARALTATAQKGATVELPPEIFPLRPGAIFCAEAGLFDLIKQPNHNL